MSFNTPITVTGGVSTDEITCPNEYGSVELGGVLELSSVLLTLNEADDMQEKRCRHCKEDMDPDHPTQVIDGDETCEDNDDGPHEPEWSPLTWAQNVMVEVDEEQDSVTLTLAHADPRGGWAMRFWRNQESGQIMMSLPHEGMSAPHAPMRRIGGGTYEVG